MFNLLGMMGNYDTRKIGRWDGDNNTKTVSTCLVTDGKCLYETAFRHPEYNNGSMVIVEAYATREEAVAGHERWVKIMTDGPLPDVLHDCCNSEISQLCAAIGNDHVHKRTHGAEGGK